MQQEDDPRFSEGKREASLSDMQRVAQRLAPVTVAATRLDLTDQAAFEEFVATELSQKQQKWDMSDRDQKRKWEGIESTNRRLMGNISQHADNYVDAVDRYRRGTVMSADDWERFLQWVQFDLDRDEIPPQILTTLKSVGSSSSTIEEAKKKYLRLKDGNLLGESMAVQRRPKPAKLASLDRWLPPEGKKSLADVTCPVIQMNIDVKIASGAERYILWSGGGADCIIVGAFRNGQAYLWHATALDCIGDPEGVATRITDAVGEGAFVALASQKLATEGADKVRVAVAKVHQLGDRVYASSSLALNAQTGEFVHQFSYEGLPR
jgi:hypothetical protein